MTKTIEISENPRKNREIEKWGECQFSKMFYQTEKLDEIPNRNH